MGHRPSEAESETEAQREVVPRIVILHMTTQQRERRSAGRLAPRRTQQLDVAIADKRREAFPIARRVVVGGAHRRHRLGERARHLFRGRERKGHIGPRTEDRVEEELERVGCADGACEEKSTDALHEGAESRIVWQSHGNLKTASGKLRFAILSRKIAFCPKPAMLRAMSFSLPQDLIDRLEEQFGVAKARQAVMGMTKRYVTLRVNTLKSNDAAIMELFRKELIQFERAKGLPHAFIVKNRKAKELLNHKMCLEGLVYLQGLTSMLPPIVLDPQPNESIADFCAAPGSKTSQMAAMLGPTANISAFEPNFIRLQKLHNTLKIQGADFVKTQQVDSTKLGTLMPEAFDKILLDVPCSGEGRIDADDDSSFETWNDATHAEYPELQRRLFTSAYMALKPGGTLVYSTCTLDPNENERIVNWALNEFPDLVAEPVVLPFPGILHKETKSITLLPTKLYEGFYVAKLKKSQA